MSGGSAAGGRAYRVEAVVLRRFSLGETDRIVTLLTRDHGKLGAVAKGSRGPRSRLSGATEPFTRFTGLLARGQNLEVLTQAEVRQAYPGIRKDLARIGYASYFLELVDVGLTERQPAAGLWSLLVEALDLLEQAPAPEPLARAFEIHAMSLLGYEPQLFHCVADGRPVGGPGGVFHPLQGGLVCPACAPSIRGGIHIQAGTLRALRDLAGAGLSRAAGGRLPDAVRRELARCMVPYVRHHLAADLRALQFLDAVLPDSSG